MQTSIVIPVWNGAAVIGQCLDAVCARAGDELLEVICVDNASTDDSARLIAERYPHVHLIRQPVNLGFAGGVNAGIDAARGEVFVLLNQDCVVHDGWLIALIHALDARPQFGIAGCAIFSVDGALNHAGATVRRPDAYGIHLTDPGDNRPRGVEYVTGAAMAIRRSTWEKVGRFDEGFYPAYYEESDYCYRARRKGLEVGYIPDARITHLSSSREWQTDPIKHAANQHLSRYRFVAKHFDSGEIGRFFEAEEAAVERERYFDQAVGRTIASRATLRNLPDVLERRRLDLDDALPPVDRRRLQVGFTQVLRRSFAVAEAISQPHMRNLPGDREERRRAIQLRLDSLRQREHDLLARIYFKAPSATGAEPRLKRLFRLLILRLPSFLIGREQALLAELSAIHVARQDLADLNLSHIEQRLKLLEVLTDYDYR
jgi:GT2 family glycosyltransferase